MTNHMERLLGGRYRVIKELARGGFGITYLAEDTQSPNSPCVIKKLDPHNIDIIETAKLLFRREVAILKYLQKKQQIPKFLNYFEKDENYYLVQEYIQGKTVYELLDEEWTKPRVVNFLREVLSILKYLHQIKVIHRDIKPSNVMRRDEDKKFVLIDFGAVKQLDINYSWTTQPIVTIVGTRGYSAPEQMQGTPGLNSDIYALGMTAIHLLTKVNPRDFQRDGEGHILWQGRIDIFDPLTAILAKMVYSHPEERYQFVEDVITDLSDLVGVSEEDFYKNSHRVGIVSQHQLSNMMAKTWKENQSPDSNHIGSNNNFGRQQLTFDNTKRDVSLPVIKLWQIAIALTALGAIAIFVEFTHPFLRPLYYLNQGNNLLDARQPEKAVEEFENVIAIKPDSAEAFKGEGDAMLILGRNQAALAYYDKSLSFRPNDIKTLNNKGKALYNLGQYKESLETHEQALALNPNNAEALSGKGFAYIGLHQVKEASDIFNKLKAIKPDDPEIWQNIGRATEQLQGSDAARTFYQEAISSYDTLLKRKPNDPIARTERGSVLLKLQRIPEALESYQKALDIDKNFYEALMGKGNALSNIPGKELEAFFAFDQASQIRPKDYQVWHNRGTILAQSLKKYDDALKSFDRAIELRSDFFSAWVSKGLVLSELKNYNEALAAFDKAKNLNPKDPYVWAYRGDTLDQLGRKQEAQNSYNEAVKRGFPPDQLPSGQSKPPAKYISSTARRK
ncbi:MAG: tetratricopeptide repeat protein [Stigonema ocellatum SAG 48.90 = DSM 106950]|nr:tetratricopeptide repeat protein [Stigonema ocellatum SAG 48.90 = DSM 106950]